MEFPQFSGRVVERKQLAAALANIERVGATWLLVGEAGIGKTRLAEEISRDARESSKTVVWGRAWESGGAPVFWPWIQVLRSLPGGAAFGLRCDRIIGQLRSESLDGEREKLSSRRGETAVSRFQIFDEVGSLLSEASARCPVLLVIDDLHALDPSSLALFDFIARVCKPPGLLLLGTYRTQELFDLRIQQMIAKIDQLGHTLHLERLSADDVAQVLQRPLSHDGVRRLYDVTEGHPLYLAQLIPFVDAAIDDDRCSELPMGLDMAIGHRLSQLESPTKAILERASVIGRSFNRSLLAALGQQCESEVAAQLEIAVASGVVVATSSEDYRFSHLLVQRSLHNNFDKEFRSNLHLRAAELVRERMVIDPECTWNRVERHYFFSGPKFRIEAIKAAYRAGEFAMQSLAFEVAQNSFERALSSARHVVELPSELRIDLMIAAANSAAAMGEILRCRSRALEASEMAKEVGDIERVVEAALALGSVFVLGQVDPTLVSTLAQALELLPSGDSVARARVLARYASAIQPAPNLRYPITLAREAIAIARRVGGPEIQLGVLRDACSAMVDIADPEDRAVYDREYVEFAQRLQRPFEEFRGRLRLAFDELERGKLLEFDRQVATLRSLLEDQGLSSLTWQLYCLQAMRAAMRGQFDVAKTEAEKASTAAEHSRDPHVGRALLLMRSGIARTQTDASSLGSMIDESSQQFQGEYLEVMANLWVAALLARLPGHGYTTEIAIPDEEIIALGLRSGDQTLAVLLADLVWVTGEVGVASRVRKALESRNGVLVSWGLFGMACDGMVARALAIVCAVMGDDLAAKRYFVLAETDARRLGLKPDLARVLYDRALYEFRYVKNDPSIVEPFVQEAQGIATELNMPGLLSACHEFVREMVVGRSCPSPTPTLTSAPTPNLDQDSVVSGGIPSPELIRDGEIYRLYLHRHGSPVELALRPTKGIDMLAHLLASPRKEFHVLDLVHLVQIHGPGQGQSQSQSQSQSQGEVDMVDTGDAGEVLDAQARSEYRRHAEQLRDAMALACELGDSERAEQIANELEFVEHELTRAVGLGGRPRKSGSAAERARVNVQRRLKNAIGRIGLQSPELARYLGACIKTGLFCRYEPLINTPGNRE